MRETFDGMVGATTRKKVCPFCNHNEIYISEWICKDCEKEKRYLLVSE
jgi:ribosomal protein L37AE/L43A